MDRRKFLQATGAALGAATLPAISTTAVVACTQQASTSLGTWEEVRAQFALTGDKIHMSQMFLASHPLVVREAIEAHRKNFEANPVEYWETNFMTAENTVQQAAAKYVQATPEEIALTDSTTMGLAMIYNGIKLPPGSEILTTTHDHYSTDKALEYSAARNGATIKRVTLHQGSTTVSVDEVSETIRKAIQPKTRLVAVTWVHSSTGVKLPIAAIAKVVAEANRARDQKDRIYLCVDGVHGFGVENVSMAELGCDFFAAGTHKWIFGPRGTGIVFAKKDAWDMLALTIPSFAYNCWAEELGWPGAKVTFGERFSPGGFHSFEYRWSLNTAFDFQLQIGKARVEQYTHDLSTTLKKGLAGMKHIKLHTPMNPTFSAGINCFEVQGLKPDEVVKRFHEKGITATTTPYRTSFARLTPSMVNTEEDVTKVLRVLGDMKA